MNTSNEKMKWIMFWTFLVLFVMSVLGTLGVVFFGFGTPNESERELLVKGLIGEIAACVIALFYSIFGLKKDDGVPSEKISSLEARIVALEQKNTLSTEEIEVPMNSVSLNRKQENVKSHNTFSVEASIEGFTKPAPFEKSIYNTTPSFTDIKADIKNSKPYDKEYRVKSYIGLKVQWKCAFSSITEYDDHYQVSAESEKMLNTVEFKIEKTKDISQLKIMDEHTPIWVCGEISKVSGTYIDLIEADFAI
ncbi:hypothetical protein [Agarivorans sp. Z349TD_8]|uniref:hypothetical protein n=1 Tax=Agarivorans sp. Z349TD_8 TaxID=3421434 RepID=UPI003D7CE341